VDALVKTAHALSDPTRVRIISALLDQELCVCELCDVLDVTQSTLSTHLQVIRNAGLVSARKEGKWIYYQMSRPLRKPMQAFFQSFPPGKGGSLRADARRLKERLSMRDNGACCVGYKTKRRAA
jgi:ArsR family transcriptional regulator, arsenate/arsenite/antimonite-responsive transcriptional repressor